MGPGRDDRTARDREDAPDGRLGRGPRRAAPRTARSRGRLRTRSAGGRDRRWEGWCGRACRPASSSSAGGLHRSLVGRVRRIRYLRHDRHPAEPRHALSHPHLRPAARRRCRLVGPPGRLGPSPARPRPADLPRPARPPWDHPGRHRQGRLARSTRAGEQGPSRVRRVGRGRGRAAPARHRERASCRPARSSCRRPTSTSCPRRRRRRSTSTIPTRRSTRACVSSTATSTSGASRCSGA